MLCTVSVHMYRVDVAITLSQLRCQSCATKKSCESTSSVVAVLFTSSRACSGKYYGAYVYVLRSRFIGSVLI